MQLTVIYQYDAQGTQFSVYGYGNGHDAAIRFCFLAIGAPPVSAPALADTWQMPGLYVFFPPSSTYDWASLSKRIYALYVRYSIYHLRFAWTDAAAGLLSGIYINNGVVTAQSNIVFRQFQLLIQGQPSIGLNASQDGFTISPGNINFLPDRFNAQSEAIPVSSSLGITASASNQGLLQFRLDLTTNLLAACHAGIHFYNSSLQPGDTNQPDYPYYFSFDYPVVGPSKTLTLNASLDILAPLDPIRSGFTFGDAGAIPSFLSTRTGHFISLQPAPTLCSGGNGFAFVNYPQAAQEEGLLCLSLQGSYILAIDGTTDYPASQNHQQLLCGLSGTEHIAIITQSKDYAGDIIDFIPGNKAFAPLFPVIRQNGSNVSPIPLLTANDHCATSWVQVRKNASPPADGNINFYYCQPGDAALFKPNGSDVFLELFDAEAGNTYNTGSIDPDPVAKCFPMVPYASAAQAFTTPAYPGTIQDFEFQILNPFRKNAIVTKADIALRESIYQQHAGKDQNKGQPKATAPVTTTPQGLLVEIDSAASIQKWTSLLIGTSQHQAVAADAMLRLENVNSVIQSAFQTNQQFLVVSKTGSLGNFPGSVIPVTGTVFHNTISIAGWPFHINVGANSFGDFSNVLLFKFCTGALAERIQSTQSWTQVDDFAGDANAQMMLSRWLTNYCNHVDQQVRTNAAFENIHTIIHDENWNGILALNVDIGLNDFPEDIKGLLGGIDTSRFKADHFGVEINHITIENGQLTTPASSSLFGLINYVDPGYINGQQPPAPTNVDYDFKVLKLLVLFKNSAIVDFDSKLQLTINRLFDDVVIDNGSSQGLYNTILLNGSYENHNGQPSYIFNETGDQLFTIQNNVLQVVEILKVQFNTLSTDQSSDDVQSRFSIWGNLQFANLPAVDVFSFDKLSFSNLGIRMNFSDTNPSKRVFRFDPEVVSFDISNSSGRLQSFAYNYPIAISGLLFSDGQKLPKDLGYLAVSSSLDSASKAIPAGWYALSFDLNLGTLGALASKVGLTASLLLVWGTRLTNQSATDFAAGVFIRLPGTGGSSSFFSLQNVLKLSIGSIHLYAEPDAVKQSTAYLIKFSQIALKILSKQIPDSGNTMMYLFGNPEQHASPANDPSQSSLGWYAAYQKKETNTEIDPNQ